jgi:three-Cys-motif partner protein
VSSDYLIEQEDGLTVRLASDQLMDGLRLLRAYVDLFTHDLSKRKTTLLSYVDLWAGTGKVKLTPGGTIMLTSPLIAMTSPKPFDHCYFAEATGPERTALRQRIRSSDRTATVYTEAGNQTAATLIETLADSSGVSLVFVAVDRMQVQWSTVAMLSQIKQVEFIFDFAKLNLGKAPDTSEKQTQWQDFFGTSDWRKVYQAANHQPESATHQHMREYYSERLGTLGFDQQRLIESGNAYQYLAVSTSKIRDHLWDAALAQIRQKRLF